MIYYLIIYRVKLTRPLCNNTNRRTIYKLHNDTSKIGGLDNYMYILYVCLVIIWGGVWFDSCPLFFFSYNDDDVNLFRLEIPLQIDTGRSDVAGRN